MKLVLVAVVAIVALAAAAPQGPQAPKQVAEPVKIVRSEFDQKPEGGYEFSFASEDGIEKQETGEVKTVNDEENKPHDVVVVRGSYSYNDPEGKPIVINYYADETGFHAEGDSIPKAPARR